MTAFDIAWEIAKGASSDFDWFKPGWGRQSRSLKDMRDLMASGEIPDLGGLPIGPHGEARETTEATHERWMNEDVEDDAMTNPSPAVNDALESIGEPHLMSRDQGRDAFGRRMSSKLQSHNRDRTYDFDFTPEHAKIGGAPEVFAEKR